MPLHTKTITTNLARAIVLAGLILIACNTALAQPKNRPTLVVQSGHFSDVSVIAYCADERLIASASGDGAIKLWATDSGMLLRTLNANAEVRSVACSPDGQTIAAGTRDNIKFWQIETGTLVRTLEVKTVSYDSIMAASFSSDWKLLAVSMAGGLVNLWDVADGKLI